MIDKDWLFATSDYICDLRTVAVLVKDGKILVQREKDGNEYALLGGHVKIGETLHFTIWLICVKIKKYLIMESLFLKKIIVM